MREGSTKAVSAIVIGGSAGALDVLVKVLPALPPSFPIPMAVVLHLPPTNANRLIEVLRAHCSLELKEAEDKEHLAGGKVYVAPPDYHLFIEREGSFSLSVDPPLRFSRPSIDVLFESAAEAYGSHLAALLLSGANDDGARGLATIRSLGGTTLVQAPESAALPTMPEAALKIDPAHRRIGVEDIAAFLAGLETFASMRRQENP